MRAAVADIYEALGNVRAAVELRSRCDPLSDEQRELFEAKDREAEALAEQVHEMTAARDAAEDDLMELRDAVRALVSAWRCSDVYVGAEAAVELLEALVTP